MKKFFGKFRVGLLTMLSFCFFASTYIYAQTPAAAVTAPEKTDSVIAEPKASSEYVKFCWEASGKGDQAKLDSLVQEVLKYYGDKAAAQESDLTDFPASGQETQYSALNDVATCLFIQAEFLMNHGKTAEAVKNFKNILTNYHWSKSWDPRGWFWSVAEKSQASIDVMEGRIPEVKDIDPKNVVWTKPQLTTPGKEEVVDYSKYGEFVNVGTENYHYRVTDLEGLKKAVGEGIYPNLTDIYSNPRYKELNNEGKICGSDYWKFVNTVDLETGYFKWVTAKEPWGVRLFYLGVIFEKAGMYKEALKAYHSLIVHFPRTVAMTNWQTPWYPGQAAIAKIEHIIRIHPELGLEAKWMKIKIKNGFDNDPKNDVFTIWPGKLVKIGIVDKVKQSFKFEENKALGKVVKTVGSGNVQLVRYDNGHWKMLVYGKPFLIKGVTYEPTAVGQSPDKGTKKNWMEEDLNNSGIIDAPYEAWVDKNKNNIQDADEPVVGDFQLMKEMGVNTIRLYHFPSPPNKELLRKMYKEYGFMVVMGDFLGKYAIGSGATWTEGTDYENPAHKAKMMESVKKMVMEFKDEPYILVWVLGNENNYGVACNADKKPEAYFKFVDEVAQMIKSIDPNHPVAVGNGDTLFLDIFGKYCPNVDIFAANVYRGDYGFGSLWEQVADASGKPAFITEYGAPAFAPFLTFEQGEKAQADYHIGNWMDIESNTAGKGIGNSLGGIVFEWLDEWWKNYEPFVHDTKSDAIGPFPGGFYYEEWFGIVSQGDGRHSPYMRQLRKAYYAYKQLWNTP
ncbi:MAG: hypothetical protein HQL25_04170 [Candidatus Omnitrophica bacterium]|nr:hypothetical protein [Candidatus Omnitrophota bacterium]